MFVHGYVHKWTRTCTQARLGIHTLTWTTYLHTLLDYPLATHTHTHTHTDRQRERENYFLFSAVVRHTCTIPVIYQQITVSMVMLPSQSELTYFLSCDILYRSHRRMKSQSLPCAETKPIHATCFNEQLLVIRSFMKSQSLRCAETKSY